jgi:hypothetical protein
MSDKVTLSLHTLPVELVYSVLDNLDQLAILLSVRNVCIRLNAITDTYSRYKVNFGFIILRLNILKFHIDIHYSNFRQSKCQRAKITKFE